MASRDIGIDETENERKELQPVWMYALTDHGLEVIMTIRSMQDSNKSNTRAMTLIYSISLYVVFMNVPFFMGTPVLALGTSVFAGIIYYLGWTVINSRRAKRHSEYL